MGSRAVAFLMSIYSVFFVIMSDTHDCYYNTDYSHDDTDNPDNNTQCSIQSVIIIPVLNILSVCKAEDGSGVGSSADRRQRGRWQNRQCWNYDYWLDGVLASSVPFVLIFHICITSGNTGSSQNVLISAKGEPLTVLAAPNFILTYITIFYNNKQ